MTAGAEKNTRKRRGAAGVVSLQGGRRIIGDERARVAEKLVDRYERNGESIRSLATATGRSYGFVHRLLTESGATLRGRGGNTRGKKA